MDDFKTTELLGLVCVDLAEILNKNYKIIVTNI